MWEAPVVGIDRLTADMIRVRERATAIGRRQPARLALQVA
jgi:hypothetical protein